MRVIVIVAPREETKGDSLVRREEPTISLKAKGVEVGGTTEGSSGLGAKTLKGVEAGGRPDVEGESEFKPKGAGEPLESILISFNYDVIKNNVPFISPRLKTLTKCRIEMFYLCYDLLAWKINEG